MRNPRWRQCRTNEAILTWYDDIVLLYRPQRKRFQTYYVPSASRSQCLEGTKVVGESLPPPPHLLSIITPQRAAHDSRAAISNTKTKIKLKQVKRFLPTLRIELGRCLSNHCLSHLKQYSRKICSSYYNAIYYSVKEIFSCPCTLTIEIFLCWFVFALLVITFALDRRPPKKSSNSRRSGCLDYKLIFVLCVFSF